MVIHQKSMHCSNRYLLGGLALGGSLFAWDMMAELVQDLQEKYDKPYFLMWSLHR